MGQGIWQAFQARATALGTTVKEQMFNAMASLDPTYSLLYEVKGERTPKQKWSLHRVDYRLQPDCDASQVGVVYLCTSTLTHVNSMPATWCITYIERYRNTVTVCSCLCD